MKIVPCPNCDTEMIEWNTGEPYNTDGWFCPECREFYSDAEIADMYGPLKQESTDEKSN